MDREKPMLSPYYRSLTRNMVLLLVMIISLAPMVIVTGIILNQFSASHHEKVYAHLGELVLKHKQNIDGFLAERIHNIRFLADTMQFDRIGHNGGIGDKLSHLQSAYGTVFVDVGVINEMGQQVAYAGPFKLEKANYADADWFKKAIENRHFTSDVFLGARFTAFYHRRTKDLARQEMDYPGHHRFPLL